MIRVIYSIFYIVKPRKKPKTDSSGYDNLKIQNIMFNIIFYKGDYTIGTAASSSHYSLSTFCRFVKCMPENVVQLF